MIRLTLFVWAFGFSCFAVFDRPAHEVALGMMVAVVVGAVGALLWKLRPPAGATADQKGEAGFFASGSIVVDAGVVAAGVLMMAVDWIADKTFKYGIEQPRMGKGYPPPERIILRRHSGNSIVWFWILVLLYLVYELLDR